LIGGGQSSALILTNVLRAGRGTFELRVSSEPAWDTLEFRLNGTRFGRWSGEVEWTNVQFNVPAGTNVLEWRFSKDFQNNRGLDGAFLDNLDLPLTVPIDSSTPAQLEATRTSTGGVAITVRGQTNQVYLIQSSLDLVAWGTISTNVAVGGLIRLDHTAAQASSTMFYRAVSP
jgi:hypothetical protein